CAWSASRAAGAATGAHCTRRRSSSGSPASAASCRSCAPCSRCSAPRSPRSRTSCSSFVTATISPMRRWALALALLMLGPVGARAQIFARSTGEHEVREALALWAAGEDDRALERLRALDVATPPKDAAALRRGKLRVAQALGRRHPAPILALGRREQRAYGSHAAERRSADA